MRMGSMVLAAVLAAAMAHTAVAATLNPISGTVQVNKGKGYAKAGGPTQVGPGDMVQVGPGGSAQIVYENGCTFTIQPGTVISVLSNPTCTGAVPIASNDYLIVGGVIAAGVGIGLLVADDDKKKSSP